MGLGGNQFPVPFNLYATSLEWGSGSSVLLAKTISAALGISSESDKGNLITQNDALNIQ